jgi:two-component system alkaline phosphatase synthesis response regulator PhoP
MEDNKSVLVVDDEIHIQTVVAIKLRNNGFNVITANDGQEGYEKALEHKPDIIVSDFQMPKLTGIEMIEKIRGESDGVAIPVIMLTARGFAIENEQRESLNIAEYLSKPFSPKELLRTIEDVLKSVTVA